MQIKKFKPTDHNIKALIYGPAGSGKTMFGGSAANALFASAEGGLLSIADKEPDFVDIKSIKDLEDLYSYLKNEKHSFETLIIDSITEINEIIKLEIEKKTGHSMQLQDWGTLSKKIRTIFRSFRDLPMNVILVAQEQYITDEDKIRKIVPSLNGKAATEVAYFMDIVGYVNVETDGTRWIETNTNRKLLTKDRSKLIGNDTKMDFSEWEKKIKKMKTGEQKVTQEYEQPIVSEPKKTSVPPANAKTQVDAYKGAVSSPPEKKMVSAKVRDLQLELQRRGAKNMGQAIHMLTELTAGLATDFDMDENTAERWLIEIMQVPDAKPEAPKKKKAPANKKAAPKKKATTAKN